MDRLTDELRPIQRGREEGGGGFEQAQGVGEFRVLLLQLLEFGGRLDGHGLTAVVDPAPACPLVNRLGHRVAERVGDRPNRHSLNVMAPVNRGERAHLLEPGRSVDPVGPLQRRPQLSDRGLCADAKFGFLTGTLGLGRGELGFALLKLGFPLGYLGFPVTELCQLLAKRGSPLAQLGLPLGELGVLPAELAFMLAHLPAQHAFPLGEPGFPFGKLDFPLLQRDDPGCPARR